MKDSSLEDLIAQTRNAIKPMNHSPSTRWQYDYAWRKFCNYLTEQGTTTFSVELVGQFVMEIRRQYETGIILEWKFKLFRKAVETLIQYHENGNVHWKHAPKWGTTGLKHPVYINISNDYIQQLKKEGYGKGTIDLYKTVCDQFLRYLEQENFHEFSELILKDVSRFIPYASSFYQPTSMRTLLSALRSFLKFAARTNLTVSDLTCAVPSSYGRKTEIVPTITAEEEKKLLEAIDRTSAVGKRNYAIILLALRLGLRSIDIVQLKLEDIQWRTNTIEIIQQKTGRRLEIPLLADVGNAIIDYVLNGRPNSHDPYVFLRSQAPYSRLSQDAGLYQVISDYMKKAGIRQGKGERTGPHCLRHSVAARLLAAETPLPIISSILGHANKDTTKIYLSTDLEHLRACALGMDGIEVAREERK